MGQLCGVAVVCTSKCVHENTSVSTAVIVYAEVLEYNAVSLSNRKRFPCLHSLT